MLRNCEMWKAVEAKLWLCNVTWGNGTSEDVWCQSSDKIYLNFDIGFHESEICKLNSSHFASLFLKRKESNWA